MILHATFRGDGVAKDEKAAIRWIERAARRGEGRALEHLEELGRRRKRRSWRKAR